MNSVRQDGTRRTLLALLLTMLVTSFVHAGQSESWDLALDKHNVQIYTRNVEGSAFKAYKAVTVVDASLASVLAIFSNPDANREWLEGCVHFEEIERSDFYSYSAYQVWDLPWPAKDRDFVVDVNINRIDEHIFHIQMEDRAERRPEDSDRVRASMPSGYYLLTEVEPGKTEVVMSQHVEPNGNLPGWMVNSLVTDTPYKSLRNLHDLATREKYSQASFVEDDDGRITGIRLSQ